MPALVATAQIVRPLAMPSAVKMPPGAPAEQRVADGDRSVRAGRDDHDERDADECEEQGSCRVCLYALIRTD